MRDDVLVGDTPKARRRRKRTQGLPARGRLWKHSTLRDLEGWLSAEDLAPLFIFTIVRNPWDRMVSYYHWLRAQRFDHQAVTLAKTLSFEAFLNNHTIQASIKEAPSRSYVTDITGQEQCALYIRLEHVSDDLPMLEAHLGFSLALPLPRVNASDRRLDYRTYYIPQLVDIVASLAADDIVQFNYRFE